MIRHLLLLAIAGGMATSAPAETVRTRASQANFDSFLSICKAGGVAAASCTCIVGKLAATRDGDFYLDMLGLERRGLSDAQSRAEALAALNRHGLRPSQGKAIIENKAAFQKLAEGCG
jgi:hypothetical protein